MTVGIASQTFDLDGAICLRQIATASQLRDVSRRVTRTATLDGGSVIYDGGYSDSDRDLVVSLDNPTRAVVDKLQYLLENNDMLVVSVDDGCFLAAPESARLAQGIYTLRLLVKERLSA